MSSKKPIACWALTVSCNHSVLPTIQEMKDTLSDFPVNTKWCFQLEKGKTEGKDHYQVRLLVEPKQYGATMLQIFSCRKPYEKSDLSFQVESNNSIAQGGLAFYVMKDETKIDGPWLDPSYKVPKAPTVYVGNDLKCMEKPYTFQKRIIEWISRPPDDRHIVWIYNKSGCAGKSKLMKWMRFKDYDMARIPMGSATQIKTSVISMGPKTIYMVDLPRVRGGDERINELFSAIEEIKNGWVVGAMYGKNDELIMEPPHIIVFSNEVPNMSIASPDRWKVHCLYKQNDDMTERQMSTADVADVYKEQMEASAPAKRKRAEEE